MNQAGETLFAGFYACRYLGENETERQWPHTEGFDLVRSCDVYELTRDLRFVDLEGKLTITWGDGERSWIQRADNQDKVVEEIRQALREPDFRGFTRFISPLSKIEGLPSPWIEVLRSSWGVYLLTCHKTREQYVGSATGVESFHGRWMSYVRDGRNVGLESRDPSDYQVSILEVAGSWRRRTTYANWRSFGSGSCRAARWASTRTSRPEPPRDPADDEAQEQHCEGWHQRDPR